MLNVEFGILNPKNRRFSTLLKILGIVGARPNFMKMAPIRRAFLATEKVHFEICHTGQHWHANMTDVFFEQLEMPQPDHFLKIDHAKAPVFQFSQMMHGLAQVFKKTKPDLVLVVGDVNSTLAAALTAEKMRIPLAHVEAGLRSGDRTMPEEVNRILTDQLAELLFVTEKSGIENLRREDFSNEKIHLVGNVMIDSLAFTRKKSEAFELEKIAPSAGLEARKFVVLTMHRPENVDQIAQLRKLPSLLALLSKSQKVVFPVHPRTRKQLEKHGFWSKIEQIEGLVLLPPQGYLEFVRLIDSAAAVVTDSGGVQEETAWLGTPCITLRQTTERPSTLESGNFLLRNWSPEQVFSTLETIFKGPRAVAAPPIFWDGKAAERIAATCLSFFENRKNGKKVQPQKVKKPNEQLFAEVSEMHPMLT